MRTQLFVWLLLGILFLPSSSESSEVWSDQSPTPGAQLGGSSLDGQIDSAELLKRIDALQAEYVEKYSSGYDLSEVNELKMKLHIARDQNDRLAFRHLLDEIEKALLRAKPTAGVAKPAVPKSQNRIQDARLQSRFEHLRQQYFDKREAGYDLRGTDMLVRQLHKAREQRDWQKIERLLDLLEQGLGRAVPPAGSAKSAVLTYRVKSRTIDKFGVGLEWARPGIATKYSEIGVDWVRFGNVAWWRYEKEPPQNGQHTYDWKSLDKLVREYQAAGFLNIQFVLSSFSPWGSSLKPRHSPEASSLPKQEHWNDFEKFIYNLVERYDGDGRDDMPGLRRPVRYLQLEPEAWHEGYWQGTVEEYGRLLAVVYRMAKAADPNCKIMLTGFSNGDLYDDFPSQSLVEVRLKRLPKHIRKWYRNMEKIFEFKNSFDVVEFHYNWDYKGAYGIVDWIRNKMKENGYDKPIWAGDAIAGPTVDGLFIPRFTKYEADEIFSILKNGNDPKHAKTLAWYEREQSSALVKKIVVGMDIGLAGIIFGNLADYSGYWGGRHFLFQGLRRRDGSRRPAFRAYRMLLEKMDGAREVERLASTANVFAYRLVRDQGLLYVVWCDKGTDEFPLVVEAPCVRVTSIPVDNTSAPTSVATRQLDRETILLPLTTVPLLVELDFKKGTSSDR